MLPCHEPEVADLHAMLLIAKNFNHPTLGAAGLFANLHGFLTKFDAACSAGLKQLSEYPSFEEGDAWNNWILDLTHITRDAGLPWKVSKDDLRISPFVALVQELQKRLPPECRRHIHSEAALATAIVRARSNGSHKADVTIK